MSSMRYTLRCRGCKADLPINRFRCMQCGTWNLSSVAGEVSPVRPIASYRSGGEPKLRLASQHWSARAFGGGLVPGSTLMLGGEAGAGKSTLVLQLIAAAGCPALYLPTEEIGDVGGKAILERCERVADDAVDTLSILDSPFDWPLTLTGFTDYPIVVFDSLSNLQGVGEHEHPDVVNAFVEHANACNALVIILVHVNKDKDFAGLEKLKHLVGATATLRTHGKSERRTFEVIKNRFGAGHATVECEMTERGIRPTLEQEKAWAH
jgi:DNA repair protein RadA/Sms